MRFLVKWLFYLMVLAALALIVYAYVGPFFGVDFSPPTEVVREPVTLETN